MMKTESIDELLKKIESLEERLADSEQLIDAIRAGEVDAFAVNENNQPEIFTLQSGDYAYRVLIEEIGEGAINISEDGLIVYTNASFVELLGIPYEKIIGRFISDFIYEESKEKFEKLFKESLHGRSKGEIILSAGTNLIPVYISLTSLQPKLATVGIIVTDQTRIKLHERTILQYQRELELKNIELAQNNSELSSFTYIASHDLQEPLRKIQTFCNLINTGSNDELPPATRDYFQRILKASTRMQNLISSLLNYSRMNSRGMDFEMTDLNTVLDDASNNIRELLDESQAIIEHEPLPVIPCVPMQITQLFTNLIINSIKYKAAGIAPRIQISAGMAEQGEINSQEAVGEERR
ncbi:MAG TPA: histidine kinase dimerization/phospho-acceptor domain-containing protein, partial [Puia sp.]|nr:histidine kinase dimerization/phospho-acceptor domain-containing protein [Puia sp.]